MPDVGIRWPGSHADFATWVDERDRRCAARRACDPPIQARHKEGCGSKNKGRHSGGLFHCWGSSGRASAIVVARPFEIPVNRARSRPDLTMSPAPRAVRDVELAALEHVRPVEPGKQLSL